MAVCRLSLLATHYVFLLPVENDQLVFGAPRLMRLEVAGRQPEKLDDAAMFDIDGHPL